MILVTGGTGYIGSHRCVALAQAGHELLIVDNLRNSRTDISDSWLLDELFDRHSISARMHFADVKAVGESVPPAWFERRWRAPREFRAGALAVWALCLPPAGFRFVASDRSADARRWQNVRHLAGANF